MPTRELQVIRKISEIIAQTVDYEEGLRLTVKCIAQSLRVDACSIFVHYVDINRLVLEATYGFEQGVPHDLQQPVSRGITGYCFRTGTLVNAPDKRKFRECRPLNSRRAQKYKALLAVPLTVGGRVIGVLDLEKGPAKAFEPEMVDLAQAIAAPLAVFILNAKLAQDIDAMAKPSQARKAQLVLRGKAITEGVVRGRAHFVPGAEVLDALTLEYADDIETEKAALRQALDIAREETSRLQQDAAEILAEAEAGIFYAHLLLLEDPTLAQRIQDALAKGFKLRFALKVVTEEFTHELERLDNELMRERLADMKDVILRIYQAIDRLEGVGTRSRQRKRVPTLGRPIVIARELLPSQLMRMPLANLAGIVCEQGGATTHVAILAKALQIPMMVNTAEATKKISPNDDLILDCATNSCYVRPSQSVARRFSAALRHYKRGADIECEPAAKAAATMDGEAVRLAGNISLISELPLLDRYGAMGVGLYRTEFMFMIRGVYPSEDEQYSIFRQVVERGGDSSVTVRVLDVGGDKPLPYVDFGQEDNPYLGWRGIRFLLSNTHFLEPHLRAILRTTVHGKVDLLLPMVADLDELLLVKEVLERAEKSLRRAGVSYSPDYRLGIMLEVPSAVWSLPAMLPYIDFVSIGTNDLVQYTFAVDRGNSRVAHWFRQFHPVVLRLIKETCDLVNSTPGKTLSLCGEIAGNPLGMPLLLGAGLRYLSMNPWQIPEVRAALAKFTLADAENLLNEGLAAKLDSDIVEMINDFARKHNLRRT